MPPIVAHLRRLQTREEGATMGEYALLLGAVSLACVGVLQLIGVRIARVVDAIEQAIGSVL
jgi:Flp pilus assembly pilin Flp